MSAVLTRRAVAEKTGSPAVVPPIRIVHLGLGAFARSHQAWYTARAGDSANWGIAAFTGRSPTAAIALSRQDGLFTLIERAADGDTAELVGSIVEANDGANVARLVELLAEPTTAIVTLTLTEAGYRLTAAGDPDLTDAEMMADLAALNTGDDPTTPVGRLAVGLIARYRAGAAPIAIVPCDNVPGVGPWLRRGVVALVQPADPDAAAWIATEVAFVSTSVDRITPATTTGDLAIAKQLTGWADAAPVVTEPFTDWILEGEFPAGRPRWEDSGARFVADVGPFERRKLWLLNGGHSLLAYRGIERGHSTVFEAWADGILKTEVEQLWVEARAVLDLAPADVDEWLAAVRLRWQNPRIEHRLSQIAQGGEQKIPARIHAVAAARRAAGLPAGEAGSRVIAAWERYRQVEQQNRQVEQQNRQFEQQNRQIQQSGEAQ
ncbi:MAG: oxidoreductase [Glaciihabitans sp.]|nr:oxidoreductase [Glaciihabitans sp.]